MQKTVTKIFEKNISCLKDGELKLKLLSYTPQNSISLVNTNGYNLFYKGNYLHNSNSPIGEAKKTIETCINAKSSLNIIFGLGLGYLFQLAVKELNGKVILYEPDLEILYTAFNYVDFSNELLNDRVFISDNFDIITEFITDTLKYEETPSILSLKSYRDMHGEEFKLQVDRIKMVFGSICSDYLFKSRNFFAMTYYLFQNIPDLMNEIPLEKIKNKFSGQTALLIGAGPSLDYNIELIKNYRNRFTIFAVGTSMKTLVANDITPDFLVAIETVDCTNQFLGVDLTEVNFITQPCSNPALHKVKAKKIYSHIAQNIEVNTIWANISDAEISNYYTSGTVAFCAMDSARILGFSKIIALGLDLAFLKGRCYSKNSVYKDLICDYNPETEKIEIFAKDLGDFANSLIINGAYDDKIKYAKQRIEELNKNLFYVKSVTGEIIPTNKEYALFIQHFTEYSKMFPKLKLINSSMFGAKIEGFEDVEFEMAVKNLPQAMSIDLSVDYNYDTNRIIDRLKTVLENFIGYSDVFKQNQKQVSDFLSGIKDDILTEFQKEELIGIINKYKQFSNPTDTVLKDLIIKENLEVQGKLNNLDMNDMVVIKGFIDTLMNYYDISLKYILWTTNQITSVINDLAEVRK